MRPIITVPQVSQYSPPNFTANGMNKAGQEGPVTPTRLLIRLIKPITLISTSRSTDFRPFRSRSSLSIGGKCRHQSMMMKTLKVTSSRMTPNEKMACGSATAKASMAYFQGARGSTPSLPICICQPSYWMIDDSGKRCFTTEKMTPVPSKISGLPTGMPLHFSSATVVASSNARRIRHTPVASRPASEPSSARSRLSKTLETDEAIAKFSAVQARIIPKPPIRPETTLYGMNLSIMPPRK
mmetsp:Transcript_62180/g.148340  ORF Transcript_62180/g.148340 Transcript_62180/m.148340 type:complete len:240 (+) Transcript_62180:1319-2038(+)